MGVKLRQYLEKIKTQSATLALALVLAAFVQYAIKFGQNAFQIAETEGVRVTDVIPGKGCYPIALFGGAK